MKITQLKQLEQYFYCDISAAVQNFFKFHESSVKNYNIAR